MREWSTYQTAVFDAVKAMRDAPGARALGIEAVAGSGKTTTIVEALKLLPANHRAVFLAFNKHVAETLKDRVPANVEAVTINSFGFWAVRAAWPKVRLDDSKTKLALWDAVADPERRRRWLGAVVRLVSLKKATMLPAAEVASRYDLDLPTEPEFMTVCGDVWKRVTTQTATIDFDDQWFLPVLRKLALPSYDWAFVDEAQDLSATQVELVRRIAPRVVYVGDPWQAIYGFRGADPEAMGKMRDLLGATVLPLSICYRCPRVVVEAAAAVIQPDVILPAPGAADGVLDEVKIEDLRQECQPGSWVLCRTTAPLVKECLKFIIEGVKALVKGRDLGQQLVALLEKVGGVTVEEFAARLNEWFRVEASRLEAASRDAQLQALEDRVETLHALSEGARTVADVRARIANVFSDQASPGVTFATAHRAKGLEADDVYILRPDLMPFPKAKTPWAMKQEVNLKYVAWTRAMKRLRIVRGK